MGVSSGVVVWGAAVLWTTNAVCTGAVVRSAGIVSGAHDGTGVSAGGRTERSQRAAKATTVISTVVSTRKRKRSPLRMG